MTPEIINEVQYIKSENFHLGEYLYMGMGITNEHRVCLAVAYKIDYCIKKARQFEEANGNVTFTHINKVKVGELIRHKKFDLEQTTVSIN